MGIGFKELLIIFLIVLVLFGAKRLKTLGSDLGSAIKGFRRSVQDSEEENKAAPATAEQHRVLEGEVVPPVKDKV